jgi:hypothetical protein
MIKKFLRQLLHDGGNQVRKKGLEPPRREAPDPKSGAATNYATSAFLEFIFCKSNLKMQITKY